MTDEFICSVFIQFFRKKGFPVRIECFVACLAEILFLDGCRVFEGILSLQMLSRRRCFFCLRSGRRLSEWLDETQPPKDIFLFLAGGVEVVVWRVCGRDASCGGRGSAGFSLAGADDVFSGGGWFCRISCLCGSMFPGQQGCPMVLTSCPRDDYDCGSIREWRRLISHLYIF